MRRRGLWGTFLLVLLLATVAAVRVVLVGAARSRRVLVSGVHPAVLEEKLGQTVVSQITMPPRDAQRRDTGAGGADCRGNCAALPG
ncbi:MAG: hypothetical protein R2762_25925 [Bryobacteraceae bacterium]